MVKFYKIVFGYNEADYLPITSDELHKAQVIAIQGGSASFEAGFFNNRGNDVMRIVPDWHRAKGWNKGWKMTPDDFEDVAPLEEPYRKTLANGEMLARYIIETNSHELLKLPASVAFNKVAPQLTSGNKIDTKQLADKFRIK